MIALAVSFIREEISRFIVANQSGIGDQNEVVLLDNKDIILGNISTLDNDQDNNFKNKIIISLVNIEEESTLKNGHHFSRNSSGKIDYRNQPVFLNLYLLFSFTPPEPSTSDDYERVLDRLGLLIEFFQMKKVFTIKNSPLSTIADSLSDEIKGNLRLFPELYTLTFEQINHLWGSLGGKQVPFVMYKIRLVKIQGSVELEAPLIEEINKQFGKL